GLPLARETSGDAWNGRRRPGRGVGAARAARRATRNHRPSRVGADDLRRGRRGARHLAQHGGVTVSIWARETERTAGAAAEGVNVDSQEKEKEDEQDVEFEAFLRQFQPRTPPALKVGGRVTLTK